MTLFFFSDRLRGKKKKGWEYHFPAAPTAAVWDLQRRGTRGSAPRGTRPPAWGQPRLGRRDGLLREEGTGRRWEVSIAVQVNCTGVARAAKAMSSVSSAYGSHFPQSRGFWSPLCCLPWARRRPARGDVTTCVQLLPLLASLRSDFHLLAPVSLPPPHFSPFNSFSITLSLHGQCTWNGTQRGR